MAHRWVLLLLLSLARPCRPQINDDNTYFGAIVAEATSETTLDIFVSIGTSQAYNDETQTTAFSSVSVAFNRAINTVETHVSGLDDYISTNGLYVGFTKVSPTPPRFATGRIATISFAEAGAQIDYASEYTTLEVLPDLPVIRFDTHAFVLLTGSGSSRDVRVYSPDASRQFTALTLGFSQLTDYASAPSSFTTASGVAVSSYANADRKQIAFGVFNEPYVAPTETIMTQLLFTPSLDLQKLDTSKSQVEGFDFEARRVVIVEGGRSFFTGCSAADLNGDFNGVNGFTLGDAIYVAQMWAGQVEATTCYGGDFNQVNGFTLGDAIYVAQVWAGQAVFPWHPSFVPASGRRQRQLRMVEDAQLPRYHYTIEGVRPTAKKIDVVITSNSTGHFSSTSVAFTRPISSVESHVSGLEAFVARNNMYVGFTKISPAPPRFPIGRIATITFADAGAQIDYESVHTSLEVAPDEVRATRV